MVHERAGHAALQPYGQREHEVIWSVGRADLNRVLIEAAARQVHDLGVARMYLDRVAAKHFGHQ
jgi:kynurenine 3-monooxygenase